MNQRWKNYATITFGAVVLMLFALYDRYPILNNDTGTYISSGFKLLPPIDRPIFYGLFIRVSSLGVSLWCTIFFQCIVLSYSITKFTRKLTPVVSNGFLLCLYIFVARFTIGGWFASQVMADIFVPIMILCITNYLLFENTKKQRVVLLMLIFLSVLTHNSNFVVISMCATVLLFGSFLFRSFRFLHTRSAMLFIVGIFSWLSLCVSNQLGGHGFTTSPSTHVFLMGKLAESGFLKTYLDEKCPTTNYKLCPYRDSLPPVAWEFVWDATSPMQKTGGWEANRAEYNGMIHDIVTTPKYYPTLAGKSFIATMRQLCYMEIDGSYALPWMKFDEGNSAYEAVKTHFPKEVNALNSSRQNKKTIDIPYFNKFYLFAFIVIVVVAFTASIILKPNKKILTALALVSFLIMLNAFTTASLANVNSRLGSRVAWLIPMLCFILAYEAYYTWRLKKLTDQYYEKK